MDDEVEEQAIGGYFIPEVSPTSSFKKYQQIIESGHIMAGLLPLRYTDRQLIFKDKEDYKKAPVYSLKSSLAKALKRLACITLELMEKNQRLKKYRKNLEVVDQSLSNSELKTFRVRSESGLW